MRKQPNGNIYPVLGDVIGGGALDMTQLMAERGRLSEQERVRMYQVLQYVMENLVYHITEIMVSGCTSFCLCLFTLILVRRTGGPHVPSTAGRHGEPLLPISPRSWSVAALPSVCLSLYTDISEKDGGVRMYQVLQDVMENLFYQYHRDHGQWLHFLLSVCLFTLIVRRTAGGEGGGGRRGSACTRCFSTSWRTSSTTSPRSWSVAALPSICLSLSVSLH